MEFLTGLLRCVVLTLRGLLRLTNEIRCYSIGTMVHECQALSHPLPMTHALCMFDVFPEMPYVCCDVSL